MSSPHQSLPSPSTITASQLASILALYPSTVNTVYKQNARLKDPQKQAGALEDDSWRYDELPVIVSSRRSKDGGAAGPWLEKAELERLVNWKISTTESVFPDITTHDAINVCPDTALSALTQALKGVGPATATLLLAICKPDGIPYFSDELYAWLVPPHQSSGSTDKLKLKYDVKEYRRLFEAWLEFRRSSASKGSQRDLKAVDAEKVAYVLGHWNELSPADRKSIFPKEVEDGSDSIGETKGEEARAIGAEETGEENNKQQHTDAAAAAVGGGRGIKAAGHETSKRIAAVATGEGGDDDEEEEKKQKQKQKKNNDKTKTATAPATATATSTTRHTKSNSNGTLQEAKEEEKGEGGCKRRMSQHTSTTRRQSKRLRRG